MSTSWLAPSCAALRTPLVEPLDRPRSRADAYLRRDLERVHQPLNSRQTGAQRVGGAIAIAHRQSDIGDAGTAVASLNRYPTPVSLLNWLQQQLATAGVSQ